MRKPTRDPIQIALQRREQCYQDGKLLLANFDGSIQQQDLNKTKGSVQGAVESYYRIKSNIKPEPWKKFLETGDKKQLMFDFNWWPMPALGTDDEKKNPEHWNDVFIYQLKACNIACPFCFVDRYNNDGYQGHGARFFSVDEIVDAFVKVREEKAKLGININVLRASGGEPSLVPEQWLGLLREVEKRGLSREVYVQSDTNLLTAPALSYWIEKGELDRNILSEIAQYPNFGLLSCFKGTDPDNFSENTGCAPSHFAEPFISFGLFLQSGIKIYPHLINPNPQTLEGFMDVLAKSYGEEMWAMAHLFSIGPYGPVKDRFKGNLAQKAAEWADNQKRSEELLDKNLRQRFGVGYKEASRPELMETILRP